MEWSEIRNDVDVLLTLLATHEDCQDVEVITLKQYFLDKVYERAIGQLSVTNGQIFEDPTACSKKIKLLMERIIKEENMPVAEFIERTPTKITICLDLDFINQTEVLDITLDKLRETVDSVGRVTLSKPKLITMDSLLQKRPQHISRDNTVKIK